MDSRTPTTIARPSLSLRSGTGAPIFESRPGQPTRIRRNPSRAIAALSWDGGPRRVFGQVLNVSLSGCLLCTESSIAEGTELSFEITVIGDSREVPYTLQGVVRRETREEGRRAYGVEFLPRSSQERQTVQALYAATA